MPRDDGGDLVETAFLCMGLLCCRQYFDGAHATERSLREQITQLCERVEWDWYTRGGKQVLYWHWSPTCGWELEHRIRGWNECLITYVLAAGAERYGIDPVVYHRGWPQDPSSATALAITISNCRSARLWRAPFLHALFLLRPGSTRAVGSLRRLLAAKRQPCAH